MVVRGVVTLYPVFLFYWGLFLEMVVVAEGMKVAMGQRIDLGLEMGMG